MKGKTINKENTTNHIMNILWLYLAGFKSQCIGFESNKNDPTYGGLFKLIPSKVLVMSVPIINIIQSVLVKCKDLETKLLLNSKDYNLASSNDKTVCPWNLFRKTP